MQNCRYSRIQGSRVCFNIRSPQDAHIKELHIRGKLLPLDLRRIYLQNTMCDRLLHTGNLVTLQCTGTRATGAPVVKQQHPKQLFLIKNPTYQAFARWNSLKPDARWVVKKGPLKKLISYFYARWRNDNSHLLYDGVDVVITEG